MNNEQRKMADGLTYARRNYQRWRRWEREHVGGMFVVASFFGGSGADGKRADSQRAGRYADAAEGPARRRGVLVIYQSS